MRAGGGGGGHPSSGLSEVAVERNEGGVDDDAEEYMWISAHQQQRVV